MPNRILRDWTTSEAVDKLTHEQEAAFTRILMAVDDFGRFTADPRLLIARLYPLRACNADAKRMQCTCDALAMHGLIDLYTVDGKQYLQVRKWHNVPRASKSKFPEMTADALQMHSRCIAHAQQMHDKCMTDAPVTVTDTVTEDREPKTDNRKHSPTPGNTGEGVFSADFNSFWAAYPRKVGKQAAWRSWKASKGRPPIEAVLNAILAQLNGIQWQKDGGQFIPHPATWLNQGRWADEVATLPKSRHEMTPEEREAHDNQPF